MTLTLYLHPLASFCHKVLIALYEAGTPFKPQIVDLGNPAEHARYLEVWPVGKIPVLHDSVRDRTVPETSVIIEYLGQHYPGAQPLIPRDDALALEARLWDRFFDLYVQVPMQKIVTDTLRASGENDRRGVPMRKRRSRPPMILPNATSGTGALPLGKASRSPPAPPRPPLLCRDRGPVRRHASKPRRLFRAPAGAPLLPAHAGRGAALFPALSL